MGKDSSKREVPVPRDAQGEGGKVGGVGAGERRGKDSERNVSSHTFIVTKETKDTKESET